MTFLVQYLPYSQKVKWQWRNDWIIQAGLEQSGLRQVNLTCCYLQYCGTVDTTIGALWYFLLINNWLKLHTRHISITNVPGQCMMKKRKTVWRLLSYTTKLLKGFIILCQTLDPGINKPEKMSKQPLFIQTEDCCQDDCSYFPLMKTIHIGAQCLFLMHHLLRRMCLVIILQTQGSCVRVFFGIVVCHQQDREILWWNADACGFWTCASVSRFMKESMDFCRMRHLLLSSHLVVQSEHHSKLTWCWEHHNFLLYISHLARMCCHFSMIITIAELLFLVPLLLFFVM